MRDPLLCAVSRRLAPEQKVARKQTAPVNVPVVLEYSHILSDPCLLGGVARQEHSVGEIYAAGESAAVHILDGRAAPHIWNAEEPVARRQKILPEIIPVQSPVLSVFGPFIEHGYILRRNVTSLPGRKHDTGELLLQDGTAFLVAFVAAACVCLDTVHNPDHISEHEIGDNSGIHRRLLVNV